MRNKYILIVLILSFVQINLLAADYYVNVKINGADKVVEGVSETINGISVLPMRYVVDGGSAEAKPLDYYYCECDDDNFVAPGAQIDVALYDSLGNYIKETSVTLPSATAAEDMYMIRYTYHEESDELRIVYFNTNIMIRVFSKETNGNFEINGGNDKTHGATLIIKEDANGNCVATIDLKLGNLSEVNFYISDKTQKNETGNLNTEYVSSNEFYTSEGGLIRVIYDFSTGKYTSTIVDIIPGEGGGDTIITELGDINLIREHTLAHPTEGDVYMIDQMGNRLELGSAKANAIIAEANEATAILRLHRDVLNNDALEGLQRDLYWISFPFQVDMTNASAATINPGYGTWWNIQLYNGAKRAADGYTSLSQTFWEECATSGALDPNEGYVVAVDRQGLIDNLVNQSGVVNISFKSSANVAVNTLVEQTVLAPYAEDPAKGRNGKDSNWHLLGNPSYTNIGDVAATTQENICFYYAWDPITNLYTTETTKIPFKTMFSYMVQYAGTIDWINTRFTPAALAAKTKEAQKYTLQLNMTYGDHLQDKTFVQLRDDDVTKDFDMNYDLTKIINSGSNIYSLISSTGVEVAANVVPMEKIVIPIGVVASKDGAYTFAMPKSIEGIYAELIDYEANTTTDLYLDQYTVTLKKGKFENRFAISIDPSKIVSSVDNMTSPDYDCKKFVKDGKLYIHSNGVVYDVLGNTCTVQ